MRRVAPVTRLEKQVSIGVGENSSSYADNIVVPLDSLTSNPCDSRHVTSDGSIGSNPTQYSHLLESLNPDTLTANYHNTATVSRETFQRMPQNTDMQIFEPAMMDGQSCIDTSNVVTSTKFPDTRRMEEPGSSETTSTMHTPCDRSPALSADKGKRKLSEITYEQRPFAEQDGLASVSEIADDQHLLCLEDLSNIHDECHTNISEELMHDTDDLPLSSRLSTDRVSSDHTSNTTDIILPSDHVDTSNDVSTTNPSFIRNRYQQNLHTTDPTFTQGVSSLTYNQQHLTSHPNLQETCPASNERSQSYSNQRRRHQVTMHESLRRGQRRGGLRGRGAASARRGAPPTRSAPSRQGPPNTYVHMGQCNEICQYCNARFWYHERVAHSSRRRPEYHRCCSGGKVRLDSHNENKMAEADIPEFKVRLFGVVGSRQHELPTGDSIGAIVFEGGPDVETDFDVVIEQHDRQLKNVNKLNASYMSLQFPLIFLFGEDGEMEQTSSIVPSSNSTGKEIVAHSQEITLANLKESDTGKVICARVYRKWTPTNRQGKPVLFCIMLIDKEVQHATV
ncbi:hypothetical protein CTI12_AA381250 [Artemisia annua]|uniref:Helitron helicase-like domain-containing protein n=1 Tax=Artemisia annua TaxID=35608 RepID=A0A2U1MG85_ARTAN|nr:hypothetical protein CTI12_AA381250 [Artemisia annua]